MRSRAAFAAVLAVLAALQPVSAVSLRRGVDAKRPQDVSLAQGAGTANPIRKVVTLLQNLAKKVDKEAEAEKELYEKYQCYCKTGGSDLSTSIGESSTKVPSLQSDIETAESTVLKLQQELKQHQGDRASAKQALEEATALREKETADYAKESTELKGYVSALAKAIPAIEAGMSGGAGLLQLAAGITASLRKAAAADTDLTDDDRASVLAFLSSGSRSSDSSSSQYVPKGGEIVGILKDMKENFDKSLAQVEQEEAEAVKLFQELSAAKTKEINSLGESIEKKTGRVGELKVEIVHMKDDLTDTEASLIEDQKFLQELEKDCDTKTAEFEERVKTRGEELAAIHDTIKILNDDDALDLFKKTLASASLLQTGVQQQKQRAIALLRKATKGLASDSHVDIRFLELALMGRKVDFSKVIKMIDDMVALLGQEQADDEAKRDYCNQQIDHFEDQTKTIARDVKDLEVSIEDRKVALGELEDEIKVLQNRITELDRSVMDATVQRKQENEEFTELMSSNTAAKELLGFAKARLQKFYLPKQAEDPMEEPASSLLQTESVRKTAKSKRDDPGPAPGTWQGGYQKKTEESVGILSMIDLLVRDLDKEMIEAEKQEEMSQKTYEELMNESAAKRAKDVKSISMKTSSKADNEQMMTAAEGDLATKKKLFMATEQTMKQLHGECDWLLQNFDLRKTARSDEMENLKQAKAILSGADFAMLQK